MRYYSIFSGVEAATLAWEPLGWEPACFCEVGEFPSAVLRERWPDVPNLGDITKVNWKRVVREHGAADLVVGGSPCQSFSVAGTRTGLDGASGLMWEYVRCIREVKPYWILWENVPGALSSSNGEDFRCLLEALDACGYGLAWRVLDAQFFGVAQRRRRLFLVGRLGDVEGPCKVLFEPESLRWDTPTSREKRQELAAGAGSGASCAGFCAGNTAGAGSVGYQEEVSPTLRGGGSGTNMTPTVLQVKGNAIDRDLAGTLKANNNNNNPPIVSSSCSVRRLTPRECERLMGMPDDWTKVPYRGKPAEECPDTPRYRAIGNSMAVNVMRWLGVRIDAINEGENPDEACSRLRGQIFGV